MVLVGIGTGELSPLLNSLLDRSDFFLTLEDTAKDREYIVRKILSTRLFDGPSPTAAATDIAEDDALKERQKSLAWRASVKDIEGEVLCGAYFFAQWRHLGYAEFLVSHIVSQFTLMAKVEKGSKPGKLSPPFFTSGKGTFQLTLTLDSPTTMSFQTSTERWYVGDCRAFAHRRSLRDLLTLVILVDASELNLL